MKKEDAKEEASSAAAAGAPAGTSGHGPAVRARAV